MIKAICIILFLFSIDGTKPVKSSSAHRSDAVHQEEPLVPGIYIMTTPPKKVSCSNEQRIIITNKKVCISKRPILGADQLKYATDIQYDPRYQMHYIDIGVSPAGSSVIMQTIHSLPDTQFALALEGQIICIFTVDPSVPVQAFRIGGDVTLKDLNVIHEVLKDVRFN